MYSDKLKEEVNNEETEFNNEEEQKNTAYNEYLDEEESSPVVHGIFIALTALGVVAVLVVFGLWILKETKTPNDELSQTELVMHRSVIEASAELAEDVIAEDKRLAEERKAAEEAARLEAEAAAAAAEEAKKDLEAEVPAVEETVKPQEVAPEDDGIKTVFTACNEQVTPKIEVNLRALPSVTNPEATVVATIRAGEVVTRTGINTDVGWSRVEYNGQTLYCISSYVCVVE